MTPCFPCWIDSSFFGRPGSLASRLAGWSSSFVGRAGGPGVRAPAHALAPMGWRATIPSSTPWKAILLCGKREWGLRPDTQTTCPAAGLVRPEPPTTPPASARSSPTSARSSTASTRSSIASSSRFQPRLAMSTSTKANCAGDVLRSFLVMRPSFAMAIGRLTGMTATMP